MNKRDLSGIKKNLKKESLMLKIQKIYNVYLKMDNQTIIHKEIKYFNQINEDEQELYLKNFKKVLSGGLDEKVLEIPFVNTGEGSTQNMLYKMINESSLAEQAEQIVEKIMQSYTFDTDIVITFAEIDYWKGSKKRKRKADEAEDDEVSALKLILCSINKVEIPKKILTYDKKDETFTTNSALDVVIKLNSPVVGFMFPSITDDYADVNKIIYYTAKAKEINLPFINNVLECEFTENAEIQKNQFNAILKKVIGSEITLEALNNIYDGLKEKIKDSESDDTIIGIKDIRNVLEENGVGDTDTLVDACKEITGKQDYEFKIGSILPREGKPMKIGNSNLVISLPQDNLGNVKQIVNENGSVCLMIELNDGVMIEGFNVATQK